MTATEYATALRAIAAWYDANPDMPAPTRGQNIAITNVEETPEAAAAIARALGTCKKEYTESFFKLVRDFGGVELQFMFWRETVCTKRVVGTKIVPAQPATPEREVEVVEWDCPAALLDREEEAR